MYLKLALRNAKRSMLDYFIYILSMIILTSIICLSNCIANWGKMQAGFQTMALPLLVVTIMAVLINYTNHFIIRQRAKEFATYLLLGMEKDKLSWMVLCELSAAGLVCFLLGTALGSGTFFLFCRTLLQKAANPYSPSMLRIVWKSVLQTFFYFCFAEALSILLMKRNICRLQIIQLMREKQRNQPLGTEKKSFWGRMLIISFFIYLALLSGISFMPEGIMSVSLSLISLPMLICVFSFYKWLYAFTVSLRLSQADALYQDSRLYLIAEMTKSPKTEANINAIFCICFIFSAASFVFGTFLLNPDIPIFGQTQQQWMGFLQISICIIFMVIYFSVLSLSQIIDLKREHKNMQLLFCMGKKRSELKYLICRQALIKLFLPASMPFLVLWTAAPFANHKLNTILPIHNLLLPSLNGFMVCFLMLYLCYFGVVCIVNIRYIKHKDGCR